MDRVLFDTTVLCGALLTRGVNYKLLELAQIPTLFEPVISEVVVCEFIANCRRGMRGTIYTEEEIDLFFEGFAPLLNFENIERIQIGRQLWVDVTKSKQPIGHFLYHLFQLRTGQRKEELLIALDHEGKKLKDIDPCDIHVMFGALEHDCNILLTANVDDFPKTFGKVEVVRPGAYYEYFDGTIRSRSLKLGKIESEVNEINQLVYNPSYSKINNEYFRRCVESNERSRKACKCGRN